MKTILKRIAAISVIALLVPPLTACNSVTRNFSGTMEMDLSAGEKPVECTRKDDDLFYLTCPMRSDEKPETYQFREKSNFGGLEDTVIIHEHAAGEETPKASASSDAQN